MGGNKAEREEIRKRSSLFHNIWFCFFNLVKSTGLLFRVLFFSEGTRDAWKPCPFRTENRLMFGYK